MMCFSANISPEQAKPGSPHSHFLGRCVGRDVGTASSVTGLLELVVIAW